MSKGVPKGESYNLVRERLSIQLYTGRGAPRNQDNKENIFGIIVNVIPFNNGFSDLLQRFSIRAFLHI